jgi:hypothetical protein
MADVLRPRRTRVKSGCLCCRLRRKKCDERKPVCSGCDRNKLICSWAPSSPDPGRPSDLGWRSRLESGEKVSQTGKDFTAISPTKSSSNSPVLFHERLKKEYPMSPSPANQIRLPEMFGTASLKDPSSRILFENYINNTSHLLCGIRGPENPFITCVIPLARTDSMIMDCVLALSGAHLGCATSGSDIQLASSTHYALALRQFKYTLTKTVSGKDLKPVNLLLTALMLCHVEVSTAFLVSPDDFLRFEVLTDRLVGSVSFRQLKWCYLPSPSCKLPFCPTGARSQRRSSRLRSARISIGDVLISCLGCKHHCKHRLGLPNRHLRALYRRSRRIPGLQNLRRYDGMCARPLRADSLDLQTRLQTYS